MNSTVFELYLFLNKYAILKRRGGEKKNPVILVNQIIKGRGDGNLKEPWARKLDSRALFVGKCLSIAML